MKKTIQIPEINATADFDEDWFNPVKKMGPGTYRSIIENYYNAVVEIGNWSSIGGPLYVFGDTEHPCVFNKDFVATYPFGDKMDIDYPKTKGKGKIIIGSDVWIGAYATILSGVTVGNGAIIGARSVVTKNVPAYAVVGGNPARLIRFRFNKETCDALERIKWYDWEERKIKENVELMKDIINFVKKYDKPRNS